MGVWYCNRKYCDSLMPDRYSYKFNMHICDECFNELVALGISTDIEDFMGSSKSENYCNDGSLEYFDDIFPIE